MVTLVKIRTEAMRQVYLSAYEILEADRIFGSSPTRKRLLYVHSLDSAVASDRLSLVEAPGKLQKERKERRRLTKTCYICCETLQSVQIAGEIAGGDVSFWRIAKPASMGPKHEGGK